MTINEELLDDVIQYVKNQDDIITLAFLKVTVALINEDPQELENTLRQVAVAFGYGYTNYRNKREDTLNKLFFQEKE